MQVTQSQTFSGILDDRYRRIPNFCVLHSADIFLHSLMLSKRFIKIISHIYSLVMFLNEENASLDHSYFCKLVISANWYFIFSEFQIAFAFFQFFFYIQANNFLLLKFLRSGLTSFIACTICTLLYISVTFYDT